MIKNTFKKIIYWILKTEAKIVLFRYKPKIIAITGSVGKTGTKDAIYKALSKIAHVRKNNKSLNNEIGVPLTILGLNSGVNSIWHWLYNILIGAIEIIYWPKYPKWLVLEVGIDRPGEMKKTASWLRPDVAVITAFGLVPVHVEFFESPEEIMREKSQLLDYLKPNGTIILNADDKNVYKIKSHASHRVLTYGINNPESDFLGSNINFVYKEGAINGSDNKNAEQHYRQPTGISFKANYNGKTIPINLKGILGEQYVYPVLAALASGVAINKSLVDLGEGLSDFRGPAGRMNILSGKNNTTIIDDTYNSSPIALQKAIETLDKLEITSSQEKDNKTSKFNSKVGNKIAIIGDMSEIGRFSASEHRKIGVQVANSSIDYLVTVGFRAELIAEEAIENGMLKSRVMQFNDYAEAIPAIEKFLETGNIILVKGSQIVRMEKIVRELIAEPERASELLVRQEKEWQDH